VEERNVNRLSSAAVDRYRADRIQLLMDYPVFCNLGLWSVAAPVNHSPKILVFRN
jgi:hypothetical protein